MADQTKVDYEVLKDVASKFKEAADKVNQTSQMFTRNAEALSRSGWIGQASKKFESEVTGKIAPEYKRLGAALDKAAQVTNQISNIFKTGEQESHQIVVTIQVVS